MILMGSKYQDKAKQNLNLKKTNQLHRPKYYDEKIKSKSSKNSVPVFFLVGIIILGFGIYGIGKVLENSFNPDSEIGESANINSNFNEDNIIDYENSGSYLTSLQIIDVDGKAYNLADYQGKIVILYFHFLECYYCTEHSPNLANAYESYNSGEVTIFAISVAAEDSASALKTWKTTNAYPFILVKDNDYKLSSTFSAQYTPHMVYLDPNGNQQSNTGLQEISEITQTITSLME